MHKFYECATCTFRIDNDPATSLCYKCHRMLQGGRPTNYLGDPFVVRDECHYKNETNNPEIWNNDSYKLMGVLEVNAIKEVAKNEYINSQTIKDVIFNPPATIVFWNDGTKTVVECRGDEEFDPEKGLAMAIAKKHLGNKYPWWDEFSKWTDKYVDPSSVFDTIAKTSWTFDGFKRAMDRVGEIRRDYDQKLFDVKVTPHDS